ncbi:MAG TPA: 7-cyano-7-deazaguanine synthase, partial [Prolixibacteraceae bacterium]|nr:7-cyano-7-deazaguanine synthase [Prolixibacteraceae bacterium]
MDKSSSNKRILLGMSGGTDSSVSALLMQKSGLEVIGATFVFSELEKQNQKNIKDAKQLAEALNIKHHVIDLQAEFKEKIIKRFIQE